MSDKLTANVYVNGKWYGPAYPDAGDPPAGSVDALAFADIDDDGQPIRDEDGQPLRDGQPVVIEQTEEEDADAGAHAAHQRSSSGPRGKQR